MQPLLSFYSGHFSAISRKISVQSTNSEQKCVNLQVSNVRKNLGTGALILGKCIVSVAKSNITKAPEGARINFCNAFSVTKVLSRLFLKMTTVHLYQSDRKDKRYKAVIQPENFTIHFGDRRYHNFTIHKDEGRKRLYIIRHEKNENWRDMKTAGFLGAVF